MEIKNDIILPVLLVNIAGFSPEGLQLVKVRKRIWFISGWRDGVINSNKIGKFNKLINFVEKWNNRRSWQMEYNFWTRPWTDGVFGVIWYTYLWSSLSHIVNVSSWLSRKELSSKTSKSNSRLSIEVQKSFWVMSDVSQWKDDTKIPPLNVSV